MRATFSDRFPGIDIDTPRYCMYIRIYWFRYIAPPMTVALPCVYTRIHTVKHFCARVKIRISTVDSTTAPCHYHSKTTCFGNAIVRCTRRNGKSWEGQKVGVELKRVPTEKLGERTRPRSACHLSWPACHLSFKRLGRAVPLLLFTVAHLPILEDAPATS